VSFTVEFLSSQQAALKENNRIIVGLEEKDNKLAAEKLVMNEELAQLQFLRRFEIERERLRKELEE